MKSKFLALSLGITFLGAPTAFATSNFTPGNFAALTSNAMTKSLVETVGLAADHRAYMPASALGMSIGFDLGVDVTSISLPSDFVTAMNAASAEGGVPSSLILPKLNIHKGLPGNFDIGFSGIWYQGNSVNGFEVKWAPLPGSAALPALAARLSYTNAKLFFLSTNTWKLDAVVSQDFVFVEPYAGFGFQLVDGKVDVSGATSLPAGVSASASSFTEHFYVGLPIKLFLLRVTAEYDINFSGVSQYGAKASLSF
jgi:hypothetical protein